MVWISFVLTHVRGIEARRHHINNFILPIVEFHSVDMLSHNLSFLLSLQVADNWDVFYEDYNWLFIFSNSCLDTIFLWSVSCPSSFSLAYLAWVSGISYALVFTILMNHSILSVVTPSLLSSLQFQKGQRVAL